MSLRIATGVFVLAALLADVDSLPAQSPGPPDSSPARRGQSLEPFEILTGESAAEPGREAERSEIETDRDSFTPATTLADRGRLIVESAYSFVDNRRVKETHSFPELVLRYGLTERIELRFGWNYEVGGAGNETSGAGVSDEGLFARNGQLDREYTLSYGAKVLVTSQRDWVPGSAVIVQGFTPTGGSAGTSTATTFFATYVAGWELPNRWKLDAAFRYGFDSDEGKRFNDWAPSVVLKVPIGDRWAVHAEYFGLFSTGRDENVSKHFFSPGVHYLVTPDLEVGVRVGWGLNDQSARFFSNVGVGLRY
jgi:hypothetical protein